VAFSKRVAEACRDSSATDLVRPLGRSRRSRSRSCIVSDLNLLRLLRGPADNGASRGAELEAKAYQTTPCLRRATRGFRAPREFCKHPDGDGVAFEEPNCLLLDEHDLELNQPRRGLGKVAY
jgi:hypothetical protein